MFDHPPRRQRRTAHRQDALAVARESSREAAARRKQFRLDALQRSDPERDQWTLPDHYADLAQLHSGPGNPHLDARGCKPLLERPLAHFNGVYLRHTRHAHAGPMDLETALVRLERERPRLYAALAAIDLADCTVRVGAAALGIPTMTAYNRRRKALALLAQWVNERPRRSRGAA